MSQRRWMFQVSLKTLLLLLLTAGGVLGWVGRNWNEYETEKRMVKKLNDSKSYTGPAPSTVSVGQPNLTPYL